MVKFMKEMKITGNSLIAWLISSNVITMFLIFLVKLVTRKEEIGSFYPLIMIIGTITGFIFFRLFMKKEVKIEIKKCKINFKYLLIYTIILIGVGCFGDLIVKLLNEYFKLFGFYFTGELLERAFTANNFIEHILVSISICIVAPILEELIFRGYLLKLFQKYGVWVSILASATLFGIMHAEFTQIIPAILAGLVLGYAYYKTDDIRVPIIMHLINNVIAYTTGNINQTYLNIMFVILAIITYIIFKKDNLFKINKIKKEEYSKKYLLSSVSLNIFVIFCIVIMLLSLSAY